MPTPTYNLPLINGASPISIVNDMNALANAVDAALASIKNGDASAADIELIRQTAEAAQNAANNAVTACAKAQEAADAAQQTATAANELATTANENSNTANQNSAALRAILGQAQSSDLYNFGYTGYVQASAPGVTYSDWHWQWCNGVLRFDGREKITGTLPSDCITLPAGAVKPVLKGDAKGVIKLGYGSIGNDSGRYLAEIHYDTTTEILSFYTPYLRTSETPVFIDATVVCGLDLSKL